jgi:alanine dehydrogenase
MIIGVPKELKDHESRVGIVPSGVKTLADNSHKVLVESRAGELSSIDDEDYKHAGGHIVASAAEVWQKADMVVKVKEPIPSEFKYLRKDLVLFTYLHLAPLPELTEQLLKNKVTGIAYETIRDGSGTLPLLTPMSVADEASFWAAFRAYHRLKSVLLVAVSSVQMPRKLLWEWARSSALLTLT